MVQKILAELRRQMNGAVSQLMRELGQRESLNLGVSLPTIKDIALKYAPDHDLAEELSLRKSREARIAALYIADAALLTKEQMERWSDSWETEEIARLSAMLLFHKSPQAELVASDWLDSTDPLRQISALYIIGRTAGQLNDNIIEKAISIANPNPSAAVYCYREIFTARAKFRREITVIAADYPELKWQIEDLE